MERYLDAVDPAQAIPLALGGVGYTVPRARLGLHLRLSRIAERFDGSNDAGEMAGALREYLAACGLPDDGTGAERLTAFVELRLLNTWAWELPFMTGQTDPERKPPPYEYRDRTWAWWVHKLATRYGWSRDQVFDLWPEEAACYLQEIFISEFDEADERRSLSELAYKYDKASKKSKYVPLSRPGWMIGEKERKERRIRRDRLPVGNVIELDTLARTVH